MSRTGRASIEESLDRRHPSRIRFQNGQTPEKKHSLPPDVTMINLRTPSLQYNHGGYYAPADPRQCSHPSGMCSTCEARLQQCCPECGSEGTYKSHAAHGVSACHGCEEKICSECAHGARYTCAYFQAKLREMDPMPPLPPPTEEEWQNAVRFMDSTPGCPLFEVSFTWSHVYLIVRLSTGRLLRINAEHEF